MSFKILSDDAFYTLIREIRRKEAQRVGVNQVDNLRQSLFNFDISGIKQWFQLRKNSH